MFRRLHPGAVQSTSHASRARTCGILLTALVCVSLVAASPAAAQTQNPICQDESGTLTNMLEGFIQLTTGLGIMGLLVVWQADSLMEMFTLSREQKTAFKQHKRGALKSAGILLLLGPMFTLAGSMMGLPIAECVNLIPF